MPTIQAVGIAVPSYSYNQAEVVQLIKNIFSTYPNLERYLPVFQNTMIEKRHFCVPLDWFKEERSFQEKNKRYIEHALLLSKEAIQNCLNQADLSPEHINHLIFISSTGISTPSIDARLINQMGFPAHIKRTPIWGLGCAGGAMGLSRAYDYIQAFPEQHVLVVALELCSLTFIRNDRSKSNLIATSLFSDGAAAVLVSGNHTSTTTNFSTPKLRDTMSTIYPDSLDVMGWDLHANGLKVLFSKDIPSLVKKTAKGTISEFLAKHQLSTDDLANYILHPGGIKVIEAYEESLNLTPEKTAHSRQIIKEYGNMSSATVFFVLDRFLRDHHDEGEFGVLSALGPGFSSELVLLKW